MGAGGGGGGHHMGSAVGGLSVGQPIHRPDTMGLILFSIPDEVHW